MRKFVITLVTAALVALPGCGSIEKAPDLPKGKWFDLQAVIFCQKKDDADDITKVYIRKGEKAANVLINTKFQNKLCGVGYLLLRVEEAFPPLHNGEQIAGVFRILTMDGETLYIFRHEPLRNPSGPSSNT